MFTHTGDVIHYNNPNMLWLTPQVQRMLNALAVTKDGAARTVIMKHLARSFK